MCMRIDQEDTCLQDTELAPSGNRPQFFTPLLKEDQGLLESLSRFRRLSLMRWRHGFKS